MSYKKYYILISPLIVIIIMSIFYTFYGIFPFGKETVSWCDLDQQTIPLLMNLKDILDGKASIFYTTASGGGMNFWGVFLFFLASPFYLAVKFVEKADIIYLVNILLVLKLATASLSASLYLSLSFKKLKKQYVVLLGLIYAFCGYGLIYYQTLVWLDVMYIFPILVLSIEKMCLEKKSFMYIAVLSVAVTVNYYLAYMTIIYLLISVPLQIKYRCKKYEKKAACKRFVLSSLAAALITTPVWLCSIIQVGKSARNANSLLILLGHPPFELLTDKMCIIITNALLFVSLLFIIRNPIMKNRRLRYNLSLIVFLMIPIVVDLINKMWHGGNYQSFPLRYGYMIVFTLITITAEVFEKLPESHGTNKFIAFASLLLLGIFMLTTGLILLKNKNVIKSYTNSLCISKDLFRMMLGIFILAFCVYLFYINLYRKKQLGNRMFILLISGVFIAEVCVNLSTYVGSAAKKDKLFETTVKLENTIDDEEYYRVKSEKKYFHANMLGAVGFNSYAHYTSLTNEDYMFAMKKLGYSSYWMEVDPNGGTVLTDSLLGIKYSVGAKNDFSPYQKIIYTNSKLNIAQNLLCISPAVISSENPEKHSVLKLTDRFEIQKQIANQYFGNDDMLIKYKASSVVDGVYNISDFAHVITASEPDISKCKIMYDIDVKGKQTLYFDLFSNLSNRVSEPYNNSVKVCVNGIEVADSYPKKFQNGLLKLGDFENESAEVTITFLKDVSVSSFGVFGINTQILENALGNLKTTTLYADKNEITAYCITEKDSFLYLAVPWDSGFDTYLNGKKTSLYKVNDSFCAVKLHKGENKIKLVFYPDGLRIAVIMTATGLVFAFAVIKDKKILRHNIINTVSKALCYIGFWSVIIFVYITPVLIYVAGLILRLGV